jgi:dTDP-4-dehydrorhamnose 3,5-epimerase
LIFSYLFISPYSPSEEFEINPMDPELGIDWQLGLVGGMGVIMSPKDAQAPTLAERLVQGKLPRLK